METTVKSDIVPELHVNKEVKTPEMEESIAAVRQVSIHGHWHVSYII